MSSKRQSGVRMFVAVVLLAGAGAGGYAGWKWMGEVTLTTIQIQGLVHTPEAEVMELMRVDTGAVLFELNAEMLADRIRRHPWIMQASVSRLPTGTLDIRVTERHPVAQVLGPSGRIEYYFDRNGFRMPVTSTSHYSVPIIWGSLESYHPVRRLDHSPLREFLFLIPALSPISDALLSEVQVSQSGIDILTTPIGDQSAIPVTMGKGDFSNKFRILESFWEQEVLQHQNVQYASIDLRFDSQVVTREMPSFEGISN